jgi:hypothetical protein
MTRVRDIISELSLEVKTANGNLEREVTGGYASDLLSDVMANSKQGNIWITLQMHMNIVAVATLKELSAIVLVNNRMPEEDTLKKAEEERIPLLISKLPAFELIGRLYKMGIRGMT